MPLSGFGMGEMILIAMLVLIVFGPKRLPEITRTIGKGLREFKKGMNEIQRELETADREARWSTPKSPEPSIAAPATGAAAGAGAAVAGTATADAPEAAVEDEATATLDPGTVGNGPSVEDESPPEDESRLADAPAGAETDPTEEASVSDAHQEPPTPRPFVDPAEEFIDPWATDSSKPSMPRTPTPTPPPEAD